MWILIHTGIHSVEVWIAEVIHRFSFSRYCQIVSKWLYQIILHQQGRGVLVHPHPWQHFSFFHLVHLSYSDGYIVIKHYVFNMHLLMINEVEHFLMYFNSHLDILSVTYPKFFFVHFSIGLSTFSYWFMEVLYIVWNKSFVKYMFCKYLFHSVSFIYYSDR